MNKQQLNTFKKFELALSNIPIKDQIKATKAVHNYRNRNEKKLKGCIYCNVEVN